MVRCRRRAAGSFTLVEMLVVVAVIGVLAGLLLPALTAARRESRKASCRSNLRQIGQGLSIYQRYHRMYPYYELQQGLTPYMEADTGVFKCPNEREDNADTYSSGYMRGHPKILGDDQQSVMCSTHRGTPIGVFRDGRVADVPSMKGVSNKIYARVGDMGGPTGDHVTYPYYSGAAPVQLWFQVDGTWRRIGLMNAALIGIFANGTEVDMRVAAGVQGPGEPTGFAELGNQIFEFSGEFSGPHGRAVFTRSKPVIGSLYIMDDLFPGTGQHWFYGIDYSGGYPSTILYPGFTMADVINAQIEFIDHCGPRLRRRSSPSGAQHHTGWAWGREPWGKGCKDRWLTFP